MILFDRERAARLMHDQGLDVVLAHTRPNAGYLADYWSGWISNPYLPTEDGADYQLFVGLPADSVLDAFLTCKTGGEEQQMFHEHVRIEDRRLWGPTNAARAAASPTGHDRLYRNPFEAVSAALHERGLAAARVGVEKRYLGVEPFEQLQELLPKATFLNAQRLFSDLRTIKTEEEISRIRAVAGVAERVIEATFEAVTEGVTTEEVDRLVMRHYAAEGLSPEWAQISIGAAGAESMQSAHAQLRRGDIVRIDTGARLAGYHNDISRVAVLGQPSREVERAYRAARAGVDRVCEVLRPGVKGADVYAAAVDVLAEAGYQMFCPVICHGVGRVVHEAPFLTMDSQDTMQPGMVMAVEPPLVIKGLGVMALEDMVLVTEDGCCDISTRGRELYVS